MPIPNLTPFPHPGQPDVEMDLMAIESLSLVSGSAIDGPARLAFDLRPCNDTGKGWIGLPAAVQAPSRFEIPDVYAWVAERMAGGDAQPAQAMQALMTAVEAEYVRQSGGS